MNSKYSDSSRHRLREHLTFGLLKREEFRCIKWQNEQKISEQPFLEDIVVHQILVLYSGGCKRKAKDRCLKLWPFLSKFSSSLHSSAMFLCACKRCPTILCMCFTAGRSSLYNLIIFKNPKISHAISFFLCLQVFYFCYNHSPQK